MDVFDGLTVARALLRRATAALVAGALLLAPGPAGRLFIHAVDARGRHITGLLERVLIPQASPASHTRS